MKRVVSILLTLALCLGLLSMGVHGQTVDNSLLTYEINDGQVTITGCDPSASGEVVIPDHIEDCPVTRIGDKAFDSLENITAVTIPEGVISIGDSAFWFCHELRNVTIPDSVTTIGEDAFYYCTGLTSITIPATVKEIGSWAFGCCEKLENVTIEEGVTTIGDGAFSWCSSLTSGHIPASVTSLGYAPFRGCSQLTDITVAQDNPAYCTDSRGVLFNHDKTLLIQPPTAISGAYEIPSGVVCIDNYAFSNCTGLSEITIPAGVACIRNGAFEGCSGLSTIEIPASTSDIWDWVFVVCHNLTGIHVDENNPYYSSDASGVLYDKDKFLLKQAPGAISGSYTIPDGVRTIDYSAFEECRKLTEVIIPYGVRCIAATAFCGCVSLTSVTIPASVTEIDWGVFDGCTSLQTISFCGNAPSFGYRAFSGITATAYYHPGTTGWTQDVMSSCGGTIDWVEDHIYDEDGVCIVCNPKNPLPPMGVTVSGTVTGPNGDQYSLVLAGDNGEQWSLTTSDSQFRLENVPDGEYCLNVYAESYEYQGCLVTVSGTDLTLAVRLHKIGDINGDGRISVADVSKAYAHSKKTTFLTDYDFNVADVNNDGRITVADVSRIYAHVKKTTFLW